ncbi:MAG: hypothetical protein FJY85_15685 [Deltaproteobacteria bacterium]|nr:hypothetical protein [Deltaproteobacteria bacterium]
MRSDVIIATMLRVVLREIGILLLGLASFPAILILVLVYSDRLQTEVGMLYISRELVTGEGALGLWFFSLWFKLLAPYLVIQAVRAYRWAHRSEAGKKWANLYFCSLLVMIGTRSLYVAWDLLYFMYALGDLPEELLQFLQLEGVNLGIGSLSLALAVRCFRIFLAAKRTWMRNARNQS